MITEAQLTASIGYLTETSLTAMIAHAFIAEASLTAVNQLGVLTETSLTAVIGAHSEITESSLAAFVSGDIVVNGTRIIDVCSNKVIQ